MLVGTTSHPVTAYSQHRVSLVKHIKNCVKFVVSDVCTTRLVQGIVLHIEDTSKMDQIQQKKLKRKYFALILC